MSKSVLVIDTPENCRSCVHIGTFRYFCRITCKDIEDASVRPDWCPLMDLPEKDTGTYPTNTVDSGYAEGWNTCLDEIKGGED